MYSSFMAHFHVKTKKGRLYLYVREIARVDGKPKVISQVYIGSPEKVAGLMRGRDEDVVTLKVEQFGALWFSCEIDNDTGLCGLIDDMVPRADRETGPSSRGKTSRMPFGLPDQGRVLGQRARGDRHLQFMQPPQAGIYLQ